MVTVLYLVQGRKRLLITKVCRESSSWRHRISALQHVSQWSLLLKTQDSCLSSRVAKKQHIEDCWFLNNIKGRHTPTGYSGEVSNVHSFDSVFIVFKREDLCLSSVFTEKHQVMTEDFSTSSWVIVTHHGRPHFQDQVYCMSLRIAVVSARTPTRHSGVVSSVCSIYCLCMLFYFI